MSSLIGSPITALGYALLCEIRREPRGGYALRRLFESTPLGIFSSSPGSIYPALKRLGQQGLICAVGAGRGGRFDITPLGNSIVEDWLAQPVELAEVSGRLELCLLRFAFLDTDPDPMIAIRFLVSLVDAAKAREAELTAFLTSGQGQALSLHGRLALDHGIRSIQATCTWATAALDTLNLASTGAQP